MSSHFRLNPDHCKRLCCGDYVYCYIPPNGDVFDFYRQLTQNQPRCRFCYTCVEELFTFQFRVTLTSLYVSGSPFAAMSYPVILAHAQMALFWVSFSYYYVLKDGELSLKALPDSVKYNYDSVCLQIQVKEMGDSILLVITSNDSFLSKIHMHFIFLQNPHVLEFCILARIYRWYLQE